MKILLSPTFGSIHHLSYVPVNVISIQVLTNFDISKLMHFWLPPAFAW